MKSPPNILLILSDQQRCDTLGVLNPKIKTPNLDRIAREGMLFERAYAPTPVCLPCRASVITGQYPSRHGATHNETQLLQTHSPLISTTLRKRGYYTHMAGKSHLSSCHDPMGAESAPHIHNRGYFRNWHGPWYGFEYADISIGHSTEAHACGMHYGVWLEDRGIDPEKYFARTAYDDFGAWDLPEEHHNSTWVADVTIEAMTRAAGRGQPFFIWANFADPHNPCMVPEPWAGMYDPESIPTFGFKPGEPASFASKPPFYMEILERSGPYAARPADPGLPGAGNVSHLGYTQAQTQRNAAAYYGMVSLMDKHIGRILDALDKSGEADNTLVVFASDHGDLLGDHGMWWKSLVCFDESMRVPMLARFPDRIPAGSRCRGFQSLIDLFPTFCDFTGVRTPRSCEGVSQREVWLGAKLAARADVIVEERPYSTDFTQRFIVTDTHKLGFYADRPYGELYDIVNDPDHIHNLWDDPRHREIKEKLIARILSHEINKGLPTPGPSETAREREPAFESVPKI